MITQWSIVTFTVLSQLGAGLALFSAWKDRRDESPSPRGWKTAAAALAAALIASACAWNGLAQGAMLAAQAACAAALVPSLAALRAPALGGPAACLAGL
ncbi:MAG: hypothetical protein MJ061_05270, partial [Mailhella sp.]|nr:hypothetical protein [Mailhella sp.]